MTRKLTAAFLLALALPAAAQVVPATNYTDLWDNSATESGWGVTFVQHASNQVQAIWFTYDPRQPDGSGHFKPLWIVMPGGTWTSPTSITGDAYVTLGTPFGQPWAYTLATLPVTKVGTFTFTFSDANHGSFLYTIIPPGNLAPTDPAFGLPAFAGTRPISRNAFP